MDSLGVIIRKLREERNLPLRTVAAFLDIDQAILSKIERGHRKATREQVVKLAEYYNVEENELLIAWLSDKLVYEVENEQLAIEALQVAEKKIKYNKKLVNKQSNLKQ
jgi:HTH-type transcriptional regulator, competence development regulator